MLNFDISKLIYYVSTCFLSLKLSMVRFVTRYLRTHIQFCLIVQYQVTPVLFN